MFIRILINILFIYIFFRIKQRKFTYTGALMERKKSVNEENTLYISKNRPRLEIFKQITDKEKFENNKFNKKNEKNNTNPKNNSNSEVNHIQAKSAYEWSVNGEGKYNNPNCNNQNSAFEIKDSEINPMNAFNFDEFSLDENFKRLKSDLIPRDNESEEFVTKEKLFIEIKNLRDIERKLSY